MKSCQCLSELEPVSATDFFDLPMLADSDARAIIESAGLPVKLSPDQLEDIINAIGTNPRRLKRFSATIDVWLDLAQESQSTGRQLSFSPLDEAKRGLFLKLALIGYANSDVIAHMQRDVGLAERLQKVCNAALGQTGEAARDLVKELRRVNCSQSDKRRLTQGCGVSLPYRPTSQTIQRSRWPCAGFVVPRTENKALL